MEYFWDNSIKSREFFTLQRKIIRIMAGAQPRTSCRSLFKQSEVLPLPCQYIFSLMNFIIDNQEIFQTNASTHNSYTSNKHHLLRPNDNLPCFQKKYLLICHKTFQQFTTKCDKPQD